MGKRSTAGRGRVTFALLNRPGRGAEGDPKLTRLLVLAYSAIGAVGAAAATYLGSGSALSHPHPLLDRALLAWGLAPPGGSVRASLSAACGVGLAFAVVLFTRWSVANTSWARALHLELQPVARRFDSNEIWWLAIFSSVGEELFFRSFLTSSLGLIPATVLFGLLHQVRGPARWIWVGWAFIVGLLLALVFVISGSIVGPIVAHALINGTNLGFLRRQEPAAEPATSSPSPDPR